MLKHNLIANYFGQGWVALMGLAFVPLYIRFLGIEAYGLIGLYVVLTTWLRLLDMGMTPTLSREMARFTAGDHTAQSIRDLLRSVEAIVLVTAILIAVGIALASDWLATSWLQPETLPIAVVAQAFTVMALVTALSFVEGVYRSSIIGLQRQVLFNLVTCSMATLRGLGAVAVLAWISPTIQAFFIWQGLLSLVTVGVLAIATYWTLPRAERAGRPSLTALRRVWRFAGGMMSISFLALLLTQVDKVLLSRLLTLPEFGYYTLAAVVAGALFMLISPVTQAWYPRLCELQAGDDPKALAEAYHKGAQLVTVIAGSAAIILILFAETFLHLWTQDGALAKRVAPLLSLLALGNLLNGLMWIPYHTQLAHGWTGLTIRMNIVAVLIIVPAILWATPRYGAEGAAWVWVSLNAGYILVGVHFMYRRILSEEKWRWYGGDVLAPISMGLIAAIAVKSLTPVVTTNVQQFAILALASTITLCAAVLSGEYTRGRVVRNLKPYLVRLAK